jgi:hypothetical protein
VGIKLSHRQGTVRVKPDLHDVSRESLLKLNAIIQVLCSEIHVQAGVIIVGVGVSSVANRDLSSVVSDDAQACVEVERVLANHEGEEVPAFPHLKVKGEGLIVHTSIEGAGSNAEAEAVRDLTP